MVKVISKRNVRRAALAHARSRASVERWIDLMESTTAVNLVELRRVTPQVDQVGGALVFNLGGNNYRLICCVWWKRGLLLFRRLLTHAEYDRINVEDLCR